MFLRCKGLCMSAASLERGSSSTHRRSASKLAEGDLVGPRRELNLTCSYAVRRGGPLSCRKSRFQGKLGGWSFPHSSKKTLKEQRHTSPVRQTSTPPGGLPPPRHPTTKEAKGLHGGLTVGVQNKHNKTKSGPTADELRRRNFGGGAAYRGWLWSMDACLYSNFSSSAT